MKYLFLIFLVNVFYPGEAQQMPAKIRKQLGAYIDSVIARDTNMFNSMYEDLFITYNDVDYFEAKKHFTIFKKDLFKSKEKITKMAEKVNLLLIQRKANFTDKTIYFNNELDSIKDEYASYFLTFSERLERYVRKKNLILNDTNYSSVVFNFIRDPDNADLKMRIPKSIVIVQVSPFFKQGDLFFCNISYIKRQGLWVYQMVFSYNTKTKKVKTLATAN